MTSGDRADWLDARHLIPVQHHLPSTTQYCLNYAQLRQKESSYTLAQRYIHLDTEDSEYDSGRPHRHLTQRIILLDT